ncbi:hypothetical protein Glove_253g19 [Diversispora epigaea]|uniref:Uncharacterized protein n=1 Tax=Diversispora epigaea TaxID=1348612 RepID=A0A397IAB7_9GLOM|nr:hypothetical protein Glove_253g19 [Diversispora epigaea]
MKDLCWCYWQFPIERIIRILQSLVKSHFKPYKNLANNISLMNCISHIQYVSELNNLIIENENKKQWSNNQVYSAQDYEEEFYWPSKDYILKKTELRKLKKYYNINNNMNVII